MLLPRTCWHRLCDSLWDGKADRPSEEQLHRLALSEPDAKFDYL
ncbi:MULTISPECIES: hypothetical protein [unclassified Phormidium]|nr:MULTISPECIES: hypothetical protein [unclassified Phormidium]